MIASQIEWAGEELYQNLIGQSPLFSVNDQFINNSGWKKMKGSYVFYLVIGSLALFICHVRLAQTEMVKDGLVSY